MSMPLIRCLFPTALLVLTACTPEAPPTPAVQQDGAPTASQESSSGTVSQAPTGAPADESDSALIPTEVSGDAIALGAARGRTGAATDAKPVYSSSDTVHASVPMQGITAGAKLDAYWTYQDGQTHKMDSQTAASTEFATFTFSPADGLRAGTYNVQIDADGVPVGIVEFRVE